MGLQEGAEGVGHEGGGAEGIGEGRLKSGDFIFALTICEYQRDWWLALRMIERTYLIAVLTIAVADGGPLPRFTGNNDGAHQVIALCGRLLQQSADGITVVKCSVIGPGRGVVFSRPGQSCGSRAVVTGRQG